MLHDQRNLLRKLTAKKIFNGLKVLGSYYWSRWMGRPIHAGLPVSIAVEPTTSCNLRCPECPSGLRSFTRPTGMLPLAMFQALIDELAATLVNLTFYFQGEPYLHPQFIELVRYAANRQIYTSTSTNAHYLTDDNARRTVESGLDRLIISIDGTTQESYQAYRIGGKLAKVIEGTQNVLRWKRALRSRTPHVVFQFLVVGPNEHQVDEVRQLGQSLGVDEVTFKTAQIYDHEHGSPLIPTNERFSRYARQPDGTYRIKNRLENGCWKMWHSCVVTWNGAVVPCCFDKDAHYQLGNVTDHGFRAVWGSPAYRQFRQQLLHSRRQIDICRNCTEGTQVWA